MERPCAGAHWHEGMNMVGLKAGVDNPRAFEGAV